jgi:hypothetical protein
MAGVAGAGMVLGGGLGGSGVTGTGVGVEKGMVQDSTRAGRSRKTSTRRALGGMNFIFPPDNSGKNTLIVLSGIWRRKASASAKDYYMISLK